MAKPYIALQPSETVLVNSTATIYAAYVVAGRVPDGQERQWLQRALNESLLIARTVDEKIHADAEMD